MNLSGRDLEQLERRGLSPGEAERQLARLAQGARARAVKRACRVGDGIHALTAPDRDRCRRLWDEAGEELRVTRFVPASGAATRMFAPIFRARESGQHQTLRPLIEAAERLALTAGRGVEDAEGLFQALLEPAGRAPADLPKALLPWHLYPDTVRTGVEEHLREIQAIQPRPWRAHFSVGRGRGPDFKAATAALREGAPGAWRLETSEQSPATDTLCLGPQGAPLRTENGDLILRPGGHGALLWNLADLETDVVFLRTVDNVQREECQGATREWSRLLGGALLELRRALEEADRALLGAWLGDPEARLDRPVRVCGMVRNQGEPGGGPFWVENRQGRVFPAIVEAAELGPRRDQLLAPATHFNPVFIAGWVSGPDGDRFGLLDFRDPDSEIVTRKTHRGQDLWALEHPGLWNGSMDGWHTVFFEVPIDVFSPVKTVFDLLRPGHRP